MVKQKTISALELKGESVDNQTFVRCSFTKALLKLSNFNHCIFDTCDFSGVFFEMTSFDNCAFPGSKMSNLDFSQATFTSCNFSHTIIRDSIFQTFKTGERTTRKKTNLRSCVFTATDLTHTIFSLCDVSHLDFSAADLTQTVFDSCNLTHTSFCQATTEGISFQNCTIDHTVLDINGFINVGVSHGFMLN